MKNDMVVSSLDFILLLYPRFGAKDKKFAKIWNERRAVSREPTNIKRMIQLQTHNLTFKMKEMKFSEKKITYYNLSNMKKVT